MPTTPLGITYPDSSGHDRLWEHYQTMANNIDSVFSKPFIKCVKQASQSIPNTTITDVTWEGASEKEKFGITHSTATNTNRFTPTRAGLYRVNLHLYWQQSATGDRRFYIQVNGANSEAGRENLGTNDHSIHFSVVRRLNGTTDYINIQVYQASGGALSLYGEVASPGFQTTVDIEWIRP